MNPYICCVLLNLFRYCAVCFLFYMGYKMIDSCIGASWFLFITGAIIAIFGGYSVTNKGNDE